MQLPTTQTRLLTRLRDPADQAAWRDFERCYRELLIRFCRRSGLQDADSEDVVQSVLANLAGALPKFTYDRERGRFRDYLLRALRNAISDWATRHERSFDSLTSSADVARATRGDGARRGADASDQLWEQEWIAHHYRRALETVRATFDSSSIAIFDRSITGATVEQISAELGMSEEAVRKARLRVRRRMEDVIAEQVRDEDGEG